MSLPRPCPATDTKAAQWLAPRLSDWFTIGGTIPTGFEAYARILHPTDGPARVRWADVAKRNGRVIHALAQWHAISRDDPPPETGDLDPISLATLVEILTPYTNAAAPVWFGMWEGWGDLNPAGSVFMFAVDASESPPSLPESAPQEWQLDLSGPTFDLPSRRYHLFSGPLTDASRFGQWHHVDWFSARSPNIFWPDDHTWCVASEIDFDSTLVGGSTDLISAIMTSTDLESWLIEPTDSLTADADLINRDAAD